MKRLILFELIILFLATTFESDSPPGWFQQTIAIGNRTITDIFFTDTLNGWVVTDAGPGGLDTGLIFKTIDGGNNWAIQYRTFAKLNAVQFSDVNTGYSAGGTGASQVYKTTNSGINWNSFGSVLGLGTLEDLFFINRDTGWVCDEQTFGGLGKTTNGGITWQLQLNDTYRPKRLYFINKDTGWFAGQSTRLYFTTNGGTNWNLQFTFASSIPNLFFVNRDTGYTSSFKTTNGGFNWIAMNNNQGGSGLFFLNNTIGYNCAGFSVLQKTIDGQNWYNQTVPTGNGFLSIQFIDTFKGWSGGSILIHTTDGGGPPVGILYASSEVSNYKLDQNFPNPFNPTTIIFFKLQERSAVELLVYNLLGEEVSEMVDDDHFTAGVYQFGFDASKYDLPSGVYFYRLRAQSEVSDNVFIDTKKMIFIK